MCPEDVTQMAAGDVFKITLNSHQGAVPFQNVFHYRQTFGVTGGDILAQEFINEVYPHIQSITSVFTVYDSVEWLNYNDLGDFGIDASIAGELGLRPGEVLPTWNSWAFQYNRTTRETRNGSKRFSSVSEDDQNFGEAIGAMLPFLEAAATGLEQFVNFGGTEIWRPVIARLSPDGASVVLTNDVRSVTYKRLASQTSRKNYG